MDQNDDGIDEAMNATVRVGMTVASQIGKALAQMWEHQRAEAAKRSEQERRAMELLYESERRTALGALRQTEDPQWWDRSSEDDVFRAYQLAEAWRGVEPDAEQALWRLGEGIVERGYGATGTTAAAAEGEAAAWGQVAEAADVRADVSEGLAANDRAEERSAAASLVTVELTSDELALVNAGLQSVSSTARGQIAADENHDWGDEKPEGLNPEELSALEQRATSADSLRDRLGTAQSSGASNATDAAHERGTAEGAYNQQARLDGVATTLREQGRSEAAVHARVQADSMMKHGPGHAAALGRDGATAAKAAVQSAPQQQRAPQRKRSL